MPEKHKCDDKKFEITCCFKRYDPDQYRQGIYGVEVMFKIMLLHDKLHAKCVGFYNKKYEII